MPLVLAQLRKGLNSEGLESVLTSPVGQPPRFTGAIIDDVCVSVAGWRLLANTHLGLVLYVDDLVVDGSRRGQGYGHAMLDEMDRIASSLGASAIDLVSGVQRSEAHRFYFTNGYSISSQHFRRKITESI
jgi:GNAT superfamily N-acetyltransferase